MGSLILNYYKTIKAYCVHLTGVCQRRKCDRLLFTLFKLLTKKGTTANVRIRKKCFVTDK